MKKCAEDTDVLDFPVVKIVSHGGTWEGIAALELESLLAADLFFPAPRNSHDGEHSAAAGVAESRSLQEARESLLRAIVDWSPSTTLELRLESLPNVRHKAQGRFCITLIIRVHGNTESDTQERTIRAYLDLRSLLVAYWPEAEFRPMTKMSVLEGRLSPFDLRWAVAVGRRHELISLSVPLSKKGALGFGECSGPTLTVG